MRNTYRISVGKLKGNSHLIDLGVDERIILKDKLKKQDTRTWTKFIWFRTVTVGGLL
jgi:hypothetical protein